MIVRPIDRAALTRDMAAALAADDAASFVDRRSPASGCACRVPEPGQRR
jgi:hypothetical protein